MTKKRKSRVNHDLRRIKTTRVYRVPEFAAVVQVSVSTVRRWIVNGLPNMGCGVGRMIDGAEAKSWLLEWRAKKKSSCGHNQMYCLRCRLPRLPVAKTVGVRPQGKKRLLISGRCAVCDTKMFRVFSTISADNFLQTLRATKAANPNLVGNIKAVSDARRNENPKTRHQLNVASAQMEMKLFDLKGRAAATAQGENDENQ